MALMQVDFTEDERAFQREVASFLTTVERHPFQYFHGRGGATRALYEALGSRGWLSVSWPTEHGGGGKPLTYEYLLWDTLAYHRAARPDLGPGIVAHAIARHGSDHQRAWLLPELSTGRLCVALGYSEPDAGSDLTGLRTRAVLEGDAYVVNGEKCWTSDAHHADLLWLLCRTGAPDSRAAGLTLLIAALDSPGITVRPIETIDGHQLNQVFLDDVRVPVINRVGAEDHAWTIIRESLAVERHLQLLPGRLRRDVEDLAALVERHDLGPAANGRVEELTAKVAQVEASSLATVAALLAGRAGVEEAARTKYLGSRLAQEIPRAALDLAGAAAADVSEPSGFLWRQSIMETVAGGSTEIMLSIIGREALGLRGGR